MCEIFVTLSDFSKLIPKDGITKLLVETFCNLSVNRFGIIMILLRAVYCKLVGDARQPAVPWDC